MWPTRSAQYGSCLPHALVSYHSYTLAPFQFLKLIRLFPASGHLAWWFLFLKSFSAYTLPSWLIYLTDNRLNATLSERLLWLQFKILYISITLTNFLYIIMRYSHNIGLHSKTTSSKRAQIISFLSITEYPMLSTELGRMHFFFFLSEWPWKVDYSILQVRILRSIVKQLLRPGVAV